MECTSEKKIESQKYPSSRPILPMLGSKFFGLSAFILALFRIKNIENNDFRAIFAFYAYQGLTAPSKPSGFFGRYLLTGIAPDRE